MVISEDGRGYNITFEYRPNIVRELKSIPGHRFQGKEKGWTVPFIAQRKNADGTITHFHNKDVMEKFKKKYVPSHPDAIGEEKLFKIEELPELTISIPWKAGTNPYPYQNNGIARGLQLRKFINADQPGLGKSMQSIGTILGFETLAAQAKAKGDQEGYNANFPYPCLVICPSTLKENWRREIEEKFSNKRAIILHDKNRHTWHQYYKMGMADFMIVNYESLWSYFVIATTNKKGTKPGLKDIQFNPLIGMFKSVIIDELHKLKDPSTRQAKVAKGITTGKQIIVGLTGTPVVNKPRDLNSQLSMIGQLSAFGGYKFFMDRYCQGGTGAGNLNELNGKLNNICFFRREKQDVLKDLPDKMREVFTCDITTRAEYNLAKNDLGKFLKESGYSEKQVNKSLNAEIMVKIGVLKSISARGKLPEAFEHINEVVEAGEKIVVFIHQKFMAEALLKEFPGSVSVRGDDDREARQANVDAFQNDPKVQVIICSIKAAGVGITLTASSRLMFLELPWHAADVEQCEDRIHRIGQKNSAQISYFLGKDTIDEDIYKLIEAKRGVADAITGTTTDISTIITDITKTLFNQK